MYAEPESERSQRVYNPDFLRRVRAKQRALSPVDKMDRTTRAHTKTAASEAMERAAFERKARLARAVERQILTPTDAAIAFAAERGFLWSEIIADCRSHPVLRVRHAAIRFIHSEYPHLSLKQIGRVFARDHTSILWVLKKTAAE